eukprot:TRINITY_DN107_c0_g1_i1.p1 TRINITY_DN107_c0_g1~~TRINITY_DN107_c0_g1_i1.p1  ORF type:complete len:183 (-),score=7.64 TRINITY_DN107_c0_g1_i1:56-562(-)
MARHIHERFVKSSCMDYILIEMVSLVTDTSANDEVAFHKLEQIGFRVGQKLCERYTSETPRFQKELDVVRYLCKDIWNLLFNRRINHLRSIKKKGVYVLQDNEFEWLRHVSSDSTENTRILAEKYLYFPCGIIKGIMDGLNFKCYVSAEILTPPTCTFTLKLASTNLE